MALHAPKKWAQVARAVPHRSDQQCRERWINVLDPGLKHGGWDAAEDEALRAAVATCTKPNGKVGCARASPSPTLPCARRQENAAPVRAAAARAGRARSTRPRQA